MLSFITLGTGPNSRKRKVPVWLQGENLSLDRKMKKTIDINKSQGSSDVKGADSLINISSEKQISLSKPASSNSESHDKANLKAKLITSEEKKMAEKPTVSAIEDLLRKQLPPIIKELLNKQPVIKPTLSTKNNTSLNNNACSVCIPVKVTLSQLPAESLPERDREIFKTKAVKNEMTVKSQSESMLEKNNSELHTKCVLSSQIKLEENFVQTGYDDTDLNDSVELVNTDKQNRLECPNCDKTYIKSYSLERHWREKHTVVDNKVTKYKCPFCHFYLSSREYIISHIQQSHSEVKNFTAYDTVKEQVASYLIKRSLNANLVCPICNDVKKRKDELEKHMKEDHLQEGECNVQLLSSLPDPRPVDKNCTDHVCYICPCCHFCTPRKDDLRYHIGTHKSNAGIKLPQIRCILLYEESVVTIRNKDNTCLPHVKSERVVTLPDVVDKLPDDRSSSSTDNVGTKSYTTNESRLKEGTYICPICAQFSTNVKETSVEHMLNQHFDKAQLDINYILPDLVFRKDLSNESNGTIVCKTCNGSDRSLYTLVKHMLATCGHKGYSGLETIMAPRSLLERADQTVNWDLHLQPEELYEVLPNSGCCVEETSGGYTCAECEGGLPYATKNNLMNHIYTKHKDRLLQDIYACVYQVPDVITGGAEQIFVCKICKEKVTAERKLVEHFRVNHVEKLAQLLEAMKNLKADEEQTVCELCKREFTDSQCLRQHLIFHVNRYKWQCTYCNMHYANAAELENHNSTVHAISGEMCHICGAMFQTNSVLTRHVRTHRLKAKDKRELCQHCGASILASSLKKHIADMHIEKISCDCAICTTQEVPEEVTAFNCELCSKVFCHKYVLKDHMFKNHNESYPTGAYKCDKCSLSFSSKMMQLVHNHGCSKSEKSSKENCTQTLGVEKFATEFDKTINSQNHLHYFPDLTQIKDTIQVDKNRAKPYMCKICQKGFSSSKRVREHIKRSHTKEENKKFQCKICKKGFMVRSECLVHCKSHFSDRKFDCKVCGKRFKAADHLKEHGAIHSENAEGAFLCRICGKGFKQRGSLVAHVGYHDKLKPFKCIFCKKRIYAGIRLTEAHESIFQGPERQKKDQGTQTLSCV